jgi:hypothetical protein
LLIHSRRENGGTPVTKYISAEHLLILFPLIFATALGMVLHSLGWPLWVCIVAPGILGIASWRKTARKHDELVRAGATGSEIEWFVRKALVFHVLLWVSTVGAYFLSAHHVTKESALGSSLLPRRDERPTFQIHDRSVYSRAASPPPDQWWLRYPPEKKGALGAVRYGAALIAWLLVYFVGFYFLFFQVKKKPRYRGRRILTQEEAEAQSDFVIKKDAPKFLFGGVYQPWEAWLTHIAIIAGSGKGKTTLSRLLFQSALPYVRRAILTNPKGETISILHGMGEGHRVKIFNPADLRGVAWAMSKDITDPESARSLAQILFPVDENATQKFFAAASQAIAQEVMIAFFGTDWGFGDVLYAMRNQGRLCKVLSKTERGRELIELYFAKPGTAQDIMSEIGNKTDPYMVVAAAWQRATETISFREFVNSDYILVFGSSHVAEAATEAMTDGAFTFVAKLLLDGPEVITPETLVGVDEAWRYLSELAALLLEGRSKGVFVIINFQDIDEMREVYGERIANALVAQCSLMAFLGQQSEETARWASRILGDYESEEGDKGLVKRESLFASELLNLPHTTPANGLSGYYVSPYIGAYFSCLPGEWITANLCPKSKDVPDFVSRPAEHQYLKGWTPADLRRLGLDDDDDPPLAPSEPDGPPPSDPAVPIRKLKVLNPKKRR